MAWWDKYNAPAAKPAAGNWWDKYGAEPSFDDVQSGVATDAPSFGNVQSAAESTAPDAPELATGWDRVAQVGGALLDANAASMGPIFAGNAKRMAGEAAVEAISNPTGYLLDVASGLLKASPIGMAYDVQSDIVDALSRRPDFDGVRSGAESTAQPAVGIPGFGGTIPKAQALAEEGVAQARRGGEDVRRAQAELAIPEEQGLERWAKLAGMSAGPTLAGLVTAAATRSPTAGAAVSSAFAVPPAYGEARESGHGVGESVAASGLSGLAELVSERTGFDALLGNLSKKMAPGRAQDVVSALEKSIAGRVATGAVAEGTTEALSQAAQDAYKVSGLGETMTLDEFMGNIADSFGAGAIMGGTLGGATRIAQGQSDQERANRLVNQIDRSAQRVETPESRAVDAGREAAAAIFAEADASTPAAPVTAQEAVQAAPGRPQIVAPVEPPAPATPRPEAPTLARNDARLAQLESIPEPTLFEREEMELLRNAVDQSRQDADPRQPGVGDAENARAARIADMAATFYETMPREIGWSEIGGRVIREPERADGLKSEVVGRTSWVGKAGPNGESNFWRMRPDASLKEKEAHEAFAKAARGERLRPIEQRFIDYARKTADGYAADQIEASELYENQDEADRRAALDYLRDSDGMDVSAEDAAEALTLIELANRAADAGIDPEAYLAEDDAFYAARLWRAIKESGYGAVDPAEASNPARRDQGQEGRPSAAPEGGAQEVTAPPRFSRQAEGIVVEEVDDAEAERVIAEMQRRQRASLDERADPLVEGFKELAKSPDTFRNQLLPGRTMSEIAPQAGITYTGRGDDNGTPVHTFRVDQGEAGPAVAKVYDNGKDVWIDVSDLTAGGGAGERVYNAAFSYARNNGRNFTEDPAGLSDSAMYRRPVQQTAAMLKAGTAENIEPGDFLATRRPGGPQTRPIKAPANREFDATLRENLLTTYNNAVLAVPEIRNVRFDAARGQFVDDRTGSVVDDAGFDRLASHRRADPVREAMVRVGDRDGGEGLAPAPVGRNSLKVAALAQSLLRASPSERPALLDRLRRISSGGAGDSPLSRILPSKQDKAPADAGVSVSGAREAKDAAESKVAGFWGRGAVSRLKSRGRVEFVTKAEVIERELGGLRSEDDVRGVDGFYDPETGKAYVIADSGASDADLPGVLSHEVLHANGEQFLGSEGFTKLKNAFARLRNKEKEISAAYDRVPQDTDAKHVDEEALSYLAQEAPKHRFSQRLVDETKLFLNRMGIPLDWLNANAAAVRKIAALNLRDASNRDVATFNRDGVKFQRVFHGTPHRGIEQAGFKLNKIGTGEGAQAYGYGMYFASQKDVAESYRRSLAEDNESSPTIGFAFDGELHDKMTAEGHALNLLKNGGKREAMSTAKDMLADAKAGKPYTTERGKGIEHYQRLYDFVQAFDARKTQQIKSVREKGQLYQAEIPEDSDLLDWDKPLSEQPAKVRAALSDVANEMRGWNHDGIRYPDPNALVGAGIHGSIERQFGGPKAASEYLQSIGIPGLRYADGQSRGKDGNQTFNYVIWDEALLTPEKAQITPMYSRGLRPQSEMESAPVGAWIDGGNVPGIGPTAFQVRDVPLDKISPVELDSVGDVGPEKRADVGRYTEAMRRGEQFPNARGYELENGKIKLVDGHRRLLAAKAAGKTSLRIAVNPLDDSAKSAMFSRKMRPADSAIIFDEDGEFSTKQDLLDGLSDGRLLVHVRVKDGTDFRYGIEPSSGEYLRSTEAWQTAFDDYGEGPELTFFSDNLSWAETDHLSEVRGGHGDLMELVFVRKGGDIQRSNGDGKVTLSDGRIVPYELSPMADHESDLFRSEPAGVESGDWYTDKAVDVVGVVDLDNAPMFSRRRPDDQTETPEFKRWFGDTGAFDPANPDIRFSRRDPAMQRGVVDDELSRDANFKEWSRSAPVVSSASAMQHEFKTGDRIVVEAFHGAQRPDRIGKGFDSRRATSGPMPFFTSSPDIASGYATNKNDTSLSYEDQDWGSWFKVRAPGYRKPIPLDRAWWSLSGAERAAISALAPRVRMDSNAEEIVLGDDGESNGIGNYDWELRQARGNPLKALQESWLSSGTIYGSEERFMDVLRLAGFPMDRVTYDSPDMQFPAVFPVHVRMSNPLVSDDIPESTMDTLRSVAARDRSRAASAGADAWDKSMTTAKRWVGDLESGSEFVWTQIPDRITDALRGLGYDGIVDMGGKGGGDRHRVYIPFSEPQVKGRFNRGTYSDDAPRDLLMSRRDTKRSAVADGLRDTSSSAPAGFVAPAIPAPRDGEPWFHGRPEASREFAKGKPAFFSRDKEAAAWFKQDERGTVTAHAVAATNPARLRDLEGALRGLGYQPDPTEDYRLADAIAANSPYDGSSVVDSIYVPEVQAALTKAGFDSLLVHDTIENTDHEALVVWDAKKISAAKPEGSFSQGAPTFYSDMAESVREAKGAPKKADAKAWKQWLDGAQRRGEFKGEERDWLGVDAWLDEQAGQVTREQIQEFVAANEVQVSETVLGDGTELPEGTELRRSGASGWQVFDSDGYALTIPRGSREEAIRDASEELGEATKFGKHTLPGGGNYRELLLTLPVQELKAGDKLGGGTVNWKNVDGSYNVTMPDGSGRVIGNDTRQGVYRSNHFDKPNILAHVRFNERTDADGKRVLFIEEIQSDWHQQGRKRGYTKDSGRLEVVEYGPREFGFRNADTGAETGPVAGMTTRAIAQGNIENAKQREAVPDAPFKTSWPMLAFKRALRWAAENGFDRIAWTTGEQQVDRYDLSKRVDRIIVEPFSGDSGDRRFDVQVFDKNGENVIDDGGMSESQLERAFGNDIAERITALPNGKRETISGDGLRLGGNGMKGFYDHILPAEIGKYAKRWGVKVGSADLVRAPKVSIARDDIVPVKDRVHSIDITPQMRDSVMGGQPMFSRRKAESVDALVDVMQKPDDPAKRIEGATTVATPPSPEGPRLPKFNSLSEFWVDNIGKPLYDAINGSVGALMRKMQLAENLPPEARKAWREYRQRIGEAQKTVREIGGAARDLTPDEREMVSDFVEREMKAGVTPPEKVERMGTIMSSIMRKQSDELVRLGMLSEEARDRWDGRYLPRFYAKHLATSPFSKELRRVFLQGIKGSHLKGRGMFETVDAAEVERYKELGWEVRDGDPANGGKVTMWKDFTPTQRQKMGEVRDAMFRFARGYTETQMDIAKGKLFDQIAKTVARTDDNAGTYVQVPDTKIPGTGVRKFGNLSGMYVPREVLSQLKATVSPDSALMKAYLKGLSLWKEGKTTMNPVTHVNNVVSNVVMADLAGVNLLDPRSFKLYAETFRDYAREGTAFKEAQAAGLFGNEWFGNEVAQWVPVPAEVRSAQTDAGIAAAFANKGLSIAQAGREAMGRAYQAEDQFFKLLLFKQARAKGLDPNDAVEWAERFVFDYSKAPAGVRLASRTLFPFANYTSKAIPALTFAATHYPWRIAKWVGLLSAVSTYGLSQIHGDDDEAKEAEGKLMPEYMKGGSSFFGVPKAIRLPYNTDEGDAMYVDISRFLPLGDLFDANNQMGGVPLPAPLTPNNPVITTAIAMLANKDSFTGKDLVSESDTGSEAAWKRMSWLWKQMAPNNPVVPGTHNFNRLAEAAAAMAGTELGPYTGLDYNGNTISPARAVAQSFGVKLRPVDFERERGFQRSALDAELRELKSKRTKLNRNQSIASSVRDRELESIETKIEEVMRRIDELESLPTP